ncbi:MAG TPA: enoyl-CoA hydratase/isomerase family protein [Pyrinomonadaceae bacterium]|nr:enoyl-CoA hydratase/isomerase family protein [Pyrinomonadaceae bacterium]
MLGEEAPGTEAVVLEHHEDAAVVRLNRPGERNPLSISTIEALHEIFSALAARSGVNRIIFTGAGDVFASGANIREVASLSPELALKFALRGQELMRKISNSSALTIAAVNGYCMGGGLDLALSCRLRFASTKAVFAHPGARLGIITGWGGTQRLPRLIGAARALELFTTARRMESREALEVGLVDRICDPVLECALSSAL